MRGIVVNSIEIRQLSKNGSPWMNPELADLPKKMEAKLAGRRRERVTTVGMSKDPLYWIDGEPASVLKVSSQNQQELEDQFKALCWMEGKLPVPRPLGFEKENGVTALWMTRLVGKDASDWASSGNVEQMSEACCKALLKIHSLSIQGCPFDRRLQKTVPLAKEHLRLGLVDLERLDESRRGMKADELLKLLDERASSKSWSEDLVFTHGDYCLPNIIFLHGELQGFVDMGRCGISDRYQDLALLLRSLKKNTGKDMRSQLAQAYGLKNLDQEKIEFYQLLDEFF
jgi:aminoglycoside phosphotransferase